MRRARSTTTLDLFITIFQGTDSLPASARIGGVAGVEIMIQVLASPYNYHENDRDLPSTFFPILGIEITASLISAEPKIACYLAGVQYVAHSTSELRLCEYRDVKCTENASALTVNQPVLLDTFSGAIDSSVQKMTFIVPG